MLFRSSILDAINDELLGRANQALQAKGKKGIVVIVDNLDRIDNSPKPWGRTQPEYLFVDRGEQLKRLNCHVVFTIPLTLMFSNDYDRLSSRFGVKPKVLPMVPVRLRDGNENPNGMVKLQQMVLARAFPDIPPEDRYLLMSNLFDSPETLDRLCLISGGHIRRLLMLMYSCLQQEDPPFTRSCLDQVIQEYRDDLLGAINQEEWELLLRVVKTQKVTGEDECQTLLRSMFVFEYRDQDGRWFGINPALTESSQYKSLVNPLV